MKFTTLWIIMLCLISGSLSGYPSDSLKLKTSSSGYTRLITMKQLADNYLEADSTRLAEKSYRELLAKIHLLERKDKETQQIEIESMLSLSKILLFQNADYAQSLQVLLTVLNLARQVQDKVSEATALTLIGFNYRFMRQYDQAMNFINEGITAARLAGDSGMLAAALNEKANLYFYRNEYQQSKKLHLEALEISNSIQDDYISNYIVHDLAFLYLQEGDYRKALNYFRIDHDYCIQKGEVRQICISSSNIADMFFHLGKPDSALVYLRMSDSLAQRHNLLYEQSVVYDGYRRFFLLKKDYEKAYHYLEQYNMLSDSLFSLEKAHQIAEMTARYESDKQAQELQRQRLKYSNNRIIVIISSLFAGIIILLLIGTNIRRRQINRKLAKSNDLITNQKANLDVAFEILAQREKEISEINASKDVFFSIIAHDLRNPFGTLLGFTELLKDHASTFSKQELENITENIYESANSLYQLLENLLAWTRSQTNRLEINPRMFDLNEMVNKNLQLHKNIASHKKISLIPPSVTQAMAYADPEMIDFVVRNLISNAIKYVLPGGKVEIHLSQKSNAARLIVADDGVGITSENQEKLFRIDSKLKTPGTANERGTGLGLIICREFVLKNNGTISVESTPGYGSKFIVTLPDKKPD